MEHSCCLTLGWGLGSTKSRLQRSAAETWRCSQDRISRLRGSVFSDSGTPFIGKSHDHVNASELARSRSLPLSLQHLFCLLRSQRCCDLLAAERRRWNRHHLNFSTLGHTCASVFLSLAPTRVFGPSRLRRICLPALWGKLQLLPRSPTLYYKHTNLQALLTNSHWNKKPDSHFRRGLSGTNTIRAMGPVLATLVGLALQISRIRRWQT